MNVVEFIVKMIVPDARLTKCEFTYDKMMWSFKSKLGTFSIMYDEQQNRLYISGLPIEVSKRIWYALRSYRLFGGK